MVAAAGGNADAGAIDAGRDINEPDVVSSWGAASIPLLVTTWSGIGVRRSEDAETEAAPAGAMTVSPSLSKAGGAGAGVARGGTGGTVGGTRGVCGPVARAGIGLTAPPSFELTVSNKLNASGCALSSCNTSSH